MDLKRINYFIALAETLHFSNTADKLYISQSTLSYNIAELELELGVCLFIRNKRSVSLTAAGKELLPLAKEIVLSVESFQNHATQIAKSNLTNIEINICFDESSQRFDLVGITEVLFNIKESNPKSSIQSFYAPIDKVLDGLTSKKYDIGFVVAPDGQVFSTDFNYVELLSTSLSIISAKELDRNSYHSYISTQPLYLLKGDKRWTKQILGILQSLGIETNIHWENSFSSMLSRVSLGDGITIFPRSEFEAENKSGRKLYAFDFTSPSAIISYYAVWREDNYNTGLLQIINELKPLL